MYTSLHMVDRTACYNTRGVVVSLGHGYTEYIAALPVGYGQTPQYQNLKVHQEHSPVKKVIIY